MPYIQRDGSNAVTGEFVNPQPGYAEEWVEETDAALLAYRNPPPSAEQQRIAAVKANARRKALVTAIQGTDDAGIIAYVNNNVTDLPSARAMLANLALLVAGVIRS